MEFWKKKAEATEGTRVEEGKIFDEELGNDLEVKNIEREANDNEVKEKEMDAGEPEYEKNGQGVKAAKDRGKYWGTQPSFLTVAQSLFH